MSEDAEREARFDPEKDTMTGWTVKRVQAEAYRRGAKDFASELQRRATNWPPRRHSAAGRIDPEIAARYVLVSYDLWREIERGEWPKGGDDA